MAINSTHSVASSPFFCHFLCFSLLLLQHSISLYLHASSPPFSILSLCRPSPMWIGFHCVGTLRSRQRPTDTSSLMGHSHPLRPTLWPHQEALICRSVSRVGCCLWSPRHWISHFAVTTSILTGVGRTCFICYHRGVR